MPLLPPDWTRPSLTAELLLHRLIKNGWCRPQAFQICESDGNSVIIYMCILDRNALSTISHWARSNRNQCIARNMALGQSHKIASRPGRTLVPFPVYQVVSADLAHRAEFHTIMSMHLDTADLSVIKYH